MNGIINKIWKRGKEKCRDVKVERRGEKETKREWKRGGMRKIRGGMKKIHDETERIICSCGM
jgi:hypothetical protein